MSGRGEWWSSRAGYVVVEGLDDAIVHMTGRLKNMGRLR